MSSSLYWKIKNPPPATNGGWSIAVKSIMVRRYFDSNGDGSLTYPVPVTLSDQDFGFLHGVLFSTESGEVRRAMDELINAIGEHGEIEIWIQ